MTHHTQTIFVLHSTQTKKVRKYNSMTEEMIQSQTQHLIVMFTSHRHQLAILHERVCFNRHYWHGLGMSCWPIRSTCSCTDYFIFCSCLRSVASVHVSCLCRHSITSLGDIFSCKCWLQINIYHVSNVADVFTWLHSSVRTPLWRHRQADVLH